MASLPLANARLPDHVPPPQYVVTGLARTYAHELMIRAALDPIVGFGGGTDLRRRIRRYLAIARRRWLELAADFPEAAAGPAVVTAARLQGMLDCPPPFARLAARGRRSCGDGSLCPSCHARRLVGLWSPLDRGLFGTRPPRGARLAGMTLVVRRLDYRLARPQAGPAGLEPEPHLPLAAFLDRRVTTSARGVYDFSGERGPRLERMPRRPDEIARWRRRGVTCGLELTRIGLAGGPRPPEDADWVVRFTSILLLPDAAARRLGRDPFFARADGVDCGAAAVAPGAVRVRAVAAPSRRNLARAVAFGGAYEPALVLRGPRLAVLEALHARAGRRLAAAFGTPRPLRATADAAPAPPDL